MTEKTHEREFGANAGRSFGRPSGGRTRGGFSPRSSQGSRLFAIAEGSRLRIAGPLPRNRWHAARSPVAAALADVGRRRGHGPRPSAAILREGLPSGRSAHERRPPRRLAQAAPRPWPAAKPRKPPRPPVDGGSRTGRGAAEGRPRLCSPRPLSLSSRRSVYLVMTGMPPGALVGRRDAAGEVEQHELERLPPGPREARCSRSREGVTAPRGDILVSCRWCRSPPDAAAHVQVAVHHGGQHCSAAAVPKGRVEREVLGLVRRLGRRVGDDPPAVEAAFARGRRPRCGAPGRCGARRFVSAGPRLPKPRPSSPRPLGKRFAPLGRVVCHDRGWDRSGTAAPWSSTSRGL